MTRATPLENVRILDLSWLLPGPFASAVLSDLGADVIKIERPDGGDYLRELSPELFQKVNFGKRSVALDLKREPDFAAFERLVAGADVVIEAFRPGVATRLGIDAACLSKLKPDLVYVSVNGFGGDGPMVLQPGHDINYLALAGALSIPGHCGEPARRSGLPVADLSASLYCVINVLAALRQRDRDGLGATIDISIAESVLHWSNTRFSDFRPANTADPWRHLNPCNDVFATSDGRAIALGLIEQKFWDNFCAAAGRPDMRSLFAAGGADGKRRLKDATAELIAAHDLEYWKHKLGNVDVPFSVVNLPDEALAEPQFVQRGNVRRVGASGLPVIALPGGAFGKTRFSPQLKAAPELGADTANVLLETERSK